MIYNSSASKRSQMIKPEKLFKLPQDKVKKGSKKVNIPTPQDTHHFNQLAENRKNIKVWKMS